MPLRRVSLARPSAKDTVSLVTAQSVPKARTSVRVSVPAAASDAWRNRVSTPSAATLRDILPKASYSNASAAESPPAAVVRERTRPSGS